jgi:hypothetical protein
MKRYAIVLLLLGLAGCVQEPDPNKLYLINPNSATAYKQACHDGGGRWEARYYAGQGIYARCTYQ